MAKSSEHVSMCRLLVLGIVIVSLAGPLTLLCYEDIVTKDHCLNSGPL